LLDLEFQRAAALEANRRFYQTGTLDPCMTEDAAFSDRFLPPFKLILPTKEKLVNYYKVYSKAG